MRRPSGRRRTTTSSTSRSAASRAAHRASQRFPSDVSHRTPRARQVPVGVHPQVRVVVRPYGSSIPLGFFAFGIGMFLYAALDAPWVKTSDGHTIGLILATFVAPLELIATVFAFLARDTVAAATLGLFGGSWLVGGVTTMQAKPGVLDPGVAYFLLAFTIVIVLLGCAAFLGKPFIAVLLLVSSVRAVLAAIYELGGGAGWNR